MSSSVHQTSRTARAGRPAPVRLLALFLIDLVLLALVLIATVGGRPVQAAASAAEDLAPATMGQESRRSFRTGTAFFDDADITGGLYFYRRDRRRYDVRERRYAANLNHASVQANVDFMSGFVGDRLGLDFGVFAAHDPFNKGAVDHEMSFVPWGNPWSMDRSGSKTVDGVSIYKAAIKGRAGPAWARAGWFQPTGPGVLGVNWSIMPGTYQGFNAGLDSGGFSAALAWADGYKAPWYRTINRFRKNDGTTPVPWLWSAGARYTIDNSLFVELAYGSSKGHLRNAHLKTGFETPLGPGCLELAYYFYVMDDNDDSGLSDNDNFDGIASQHYVGLQYALDPWTLRLEGTHTRAPCPGRGIRVSLPTG